MTSNLMTPPSAWTGIYPALLTMFDEGGAVDASACREHSASLVRDGAHGLVVCGTTGEFVSLSDDERMEVTAAAVSAAAGAVPVIAGTGTASTASTIQLCRRAADVGADAALVILPYYMRPRRHEVMAHFRTVGEASPIPVFVYNNSTNSSTDPLDAVDLGQLAAEGAIVGVKSTFPTVHQVHEVVGETDLGFRAFYGSFMAALEGLAGGAAGWISGILNVVLSDALEMFASFNRGDIEGARAAWRRILPYKYLYTRSQVGDVSDLALWRAVLELRGQHGGYCRAPLSGLRSDQREALRAYLAELPA